MAQEGSFLKESIRQLLEQIRDQTGAGEVAAAIRLLDSGSNPIDPAERQLQKYLFDLIYQRGFKTQFEYRFFEHDALTILQNNEQTGSAGVDTVTSPGGVIFETGTTAGSVLDLQTPEPVFYQAGQDNLYDGSFSLVSALPTDGQIDAGAFTDTDGIFFSFRPDGTYLVHRYNSSDFAIKIADAAGNILGNHNGDPLDGSATSDYTQDGTPVTFNFTKLQIGQIYGSWRGADSLVVGLISPDRHKVPLHTFFAANVRDNPTLTDPNLPLRIRLDNGTTAENLQLQSNCWSGGNDASARARVLSKSNSTTTPLGVGGVFAGIPLSTLHYPYIWASINASHDGRYRFEWSDDGGTIDETTPWIDYSSGDGVIRTALYLRRGGFVNIRFENTSGSAQTLLEIDTSLEEEALVIPTGVLKEQIGRGDQVVKTKAALFALDGNQTKQMPGDQANGLDVDVTRSALPAGAATEAKLVEVDTALGNQNDAEATGDGSIIAILKRLRTIWTDVWDSVNSRIFTSAKLEASDAVVGYVSQSISKYVSDGVVFTAGGDHSISAPGSGAILLTNPSGSGVTLSVVSFAAYNDATGVLNISFFKNPTRVGGTSQTPLNLNFASANTPQATVYTGSSILTGGTQLSPRAKFNQNAPFSYEGAPIIVPPGQSAALQVSVPGVLSSQDVAFDVTWIETPV